MTNGDFAFFMFMGSRRASTYRPWTSFVSDPEDLPRRRRAFYAVKQVRTYYRRCRIIMIIIYTYISSSIKFGFRSPSKAVAAVE